jgi:hypothetical protein
MTDHHTTLVCADTAPPPPRRRAVLPCWQHALAAGMLLGLLAGTIRAARHEQGAASVWATMACWAVMGGPAVMDLDDRAHGHPPPLRGGTCR